MISNSPKGAASSLSMAEFNARAKKIAAQTGEIEKGSTRRDTTSRFRRGPAPVKTETAETTAESSTETTES